MPYTPKWVCRYCHKPETNDTAGCQCGEPWPYSCTCEECTQRGSSAGGGPGAVGTPEYQRMRKNRFPFHMEVQWEEPAPTFAQAMYAMQYNYGEIPEYPREKREETPESKKWWQFWK